MSDAPHTDQNLLEGLTMGTLLAIKHGHEGLLRVAGRETPTKWMGGLMAPPARLLVSTKEIFDSEEEAKAHMERVVDACIRYETPR